jgi:hypothetical protein
MTLILSGTDGLSDVDGSAATPAIRGTDANTGIFFPAADTIAFSEGGVESMRLDSSANLQFNSGYGSVATAYGCRAWVNFNGTGTVAIRASGNVTSITDNGTGDYTVNFTTAMPDANYSPNVNMNINWGSGVPYGVLLFTKLSANSAPTTASFSFTTWTSSGGAQIDPPYVLASVFR